MAKINPKGASNTPSGYGGDISLLLNDVFSIPENPSRRHLMIFNKGPNPVCIEIYEPTETFHITFLLGVNKLYEPMVMYTAPIKVRATIGDVDVAIGEGN